MAALSSPAALCLVAVVALAPVSSAAPVAPCPAGDDGSFPLETRIHGGPDSYEAGGAPGTWYIDLVNTGAQACAGVHPVVVLVDDERLLRPAQAKLDFYDGRRRRPVRLESTDQQELVGVVGADGFAGYTVAPGGTVTVRLRLMITSDAFADHVTAKAALVQRRGQDGEWVGESGDYAFDIEGEKPGRNPHGRPDPGRTQGPVPPGYPDRPDASAGTGDPGRTPGPTGPADPDEPGTAAPADPSRAPDTTEEGVTPAADEPTATEAVPVAPLAPVDPESDEGDEATDGEATDSDGDGDAGDETGDRYGEAGDPDDDGEAHDGSGEAGRGAPELARTGPALPRGPLTAAAALLVLGGAALLTARRRR
ncbi:hypothetical protein [Streptomyces sp. NPDC046860]|uniref:hypothetical protein n=1 Tax=Streptomyces sp. NPDC046860 TaxID=3154495 RepID=UPI0033E967AC